jgi:broad specificity phosphatase PhoE
MRTTLYLLRHGATAENLARPARLQGRGLNAPLADIGVRQAQVTRDFLAVRPFECCYSSPLLRAVQTAEIICQPHDIRPTVHEGLIECHVGEWEGLDWETIRSRDEARYCAFMAHPAQFGYPGGESFADVHKRASQVIEELFKVHEGETFLVIAHHIVNRTYLAGLLGLSADEARRVELDNCGISVVERAGPKTRLLTLNTILHLQGVAA